MVQHTCWTVTTRHQLLGNICSSCNMADHLLLLCIGNHQRVVKPTDILHIGIYASCHGSPTLHEISLGYDSKYLPEGVTKGSHILKLLCNIYGNKVAGHVWNKYLDNGIQEVGFEPSKLDPCLYYKGGMVLLIYVDD